MEIKQPNQDRTWAVLLLEQLHVQKIAIFCVISIFFESVHAFLQSGISCAEPSGSKCLKKDKEYLEPEDSFMSPCCFWQTLKWTYCEEPVNINLLFTLCDCVEEQVFQTGEPSFISTPTKEKNIQTWTLTSRPWFQLVCVRVKYMGIKWKNSDTTQSFSHSHQRGSFVHVTMWFSSHCQEVLTAFQSNGPK